MIKGARRRLVPPDKKDVHRKPHVSLKVENPSRPINLKEVSNGAKFAQKKTSQSAVEKLEPECNSENLILITVLDVSGFLTPPSRNSFVRLVFSIYC
ncbi:hypothetical protein HHK36_010726 [Tetracentron sinense]|uniref:Uncharacterized protein n=1 Tax=Tetracentron sinense TaxID=13715 RepID=A0A834ZHD5_TETSI|nr:hypothetical protein HHK36_010726 [Tetracentron sinense]